MGIELKEPILIKQIEQRRDLIWRGGRLERFKAT